MLEKAEVGNLLRTKRQEAEKIAKAVKEELTESETPSQIGLIKGPRALNFVQLLCFSRGDDGAAGRIQPGFSLVRRVMEKPRMPGKQARQAQLPVKGPKTSKSCVSSLVCFPRVYLCSHVMRIRAIPIGESYCRVIRFSWKTVNGCCRNLM